jgi:hypothetical protein
VCYYETTFGKRKEISLDGPGWQDLKLKTPVEDFLVSVSKKKVTAPAV